MNILYCILASKSNVAIFNHGQKYPKYILTLGMFFLKISIAWVLYFALHSLLAADGVKEYCRIQFPVLFPHYRIVYNLIAIFGLMPLVWFSLQDTTYVFSPDTWMRIPAILLMSAGVIMLLVAFASFNVKEFLGLEKPEYVPDAKLVTSGVYRYVRHPLYTAMLLLFPGVLLYCPTWSVLLLTVLAIIYIEIGSRLEEKKLIQVFGEDYIRYQQQVKRYFPFIY